MYKVEHLLKNKFLQKYLFCIHSYEGQITVRNHVSFFFEMIIEITKKSLRNHRNHSEIRGITEKIFYIKIAYFVRERIELLIGIYISMKSTFFFLSPKAQRNW